MSRATISELFVHRLIQFIPQSLLEFWSDLVVISGSTSPLQNQKSWNSAGPLNFKALSCTAPLINLASFALAPFILSQPSSPKLALPSYVRSTSSFAVQCMGSVSVGPCMHEN